MTGKNGTLMFFCSDENSDTGLSCEFRDCSLGGRSRWTSYLEEQIYTKETKRYKVDNENTEFNLKVILSKFFLTFLFDG